MSYITPLTIHKSTNATDVLDRLGKEKQTAMREEMNSTNRKLFFLIMFLSKMHMSNGKNAQIVHLINVNTNGLNDPKGCYQTSKGCTLDAALDAAVSQEKFKKNTVIEIKPGNYILNNSYSFRMNNNLTIRGLSADVKLQCSGNNSGLAFIECRDVKIFNISFVACGTLQNSSSFGNPVFFSTLFVNKCIHFSLHYVVIQKSLGVGVTIYDTTGIVNVSNVTFEYNGPTSLNCNLERTVSRKEEDNSQEIAVAGGGLYIEFTFQEKNDSSLDLVDSSYSIVESTFKANIAPYSGLRKDSFKHPSGKQHVGFSRGGGLSIYFRGSAKQNIFNIRECNFVKNQAVWGGGYHIQFLDNAIGNSINISKVNITENVACLGGGAFQFSILSIFNQSEKKLMPNFIQTVSSLFEKNTAASGGGGIITGKTSVANVKNSFCFNDCHWLRNEATIGFAMTLKLSNFDKGLFGSNCPFRVNFSNSYLLGNYLRSVVDYGWGVGTMYVFLVPLFLKNVHFANNTNTSLLLDTSLATIVESVVFSRNTGYKGGAVAMYGEASFLLTKGSNLTFDQNNASERGGAIFVETPGPQSLPFFGNNYLQTHECFFKYEDKQVPANEWQAKVVFKDNTAPFATGYSIYSNSLRDCNDPKNISNTLEWKSFFYENSREFEIVTDAINISLDKSDWYVSPAEPFSPKVILVDEKNNSVYGMINIGIESFEESVTLGTPSALFLVREQIPILHLKGKPGSRFSVDFRTVGGLFAHKKLENIMLNKCKPGFVLREKQCVCDTEKMASGISRCSEDKTVVYLKKGYWAGEVPDENNETVFATARCPTGFCECYRPDNFTLGEDECIYEEKKICSAHRKDVLCGSCDNGSSVKVGVQTCSPNCNDSDLWRLAPLLIGFTILVGLIFMLNVDVFTCYLNVWLFFYQMIDLVIDVHSHIPLDPFISFVIGLAKITIRGFGACLWKGMDNLQKLAFQYVLPVYVFIILLALTLFSGKWPNTYFSRNSTYPACSTLFVLCYSNLAQVSMNILQNLKVGNKVVVFYQGTVSYFGPCHIPFAVPALLVLLLIVIPFPFMLMFSPFFSKHLPYFVYLTPFLNTFKACFKNNCRWHASVYFFARLILLIISTFVPYGTPNAVLMQIASVLLLAMHIYRWPYDEEKYNWINRVDALLLTTLTVVSILAAQATNNITATQKDRLGYAINVFAYTPLLYLLVIVIYFLNKWIKEKRHNSSARSV
ncbi:uncharacterized protein LOC124445636 [Xenia sp. Carnegie-2017]|uniref:uncharacterized protein LOC124445636 n=1 Tax=Xenia sp. Carnegie-2017 TaxID=2897299 RepID=UPI001F0335BF|nr:uncharacterized protein LOC124445636 [Xenia sp. Carnegie-2017]